MFTFKSWGYFFIIGCWMSLSACSTENTYAPVVDVSVIEHIPKNGAHRVLPGETLYSIAWRYGLDYRYLAKRNHIMPPYQITAGQLIYLQGKPKKVSLTSSTPLAVKEVQNMKEQESTLSAIQWQWPAKGQIIGYFSSVNKGINIAGREGEPIYAAASGKIVYSNNGLRGYGHLIIIKHNSSFLTAYAHNNQVLINEGQWVQGGEQIATMGSSGASRVMLHFEIRKNGRPVNPLFYLRK